MLSCDLVTAHSKAYHEFKLSPHTHGEITNPAVEDVLRFPTHLAGIVGTAHYVTSARKISFTVVVLKHQPNHTRRSSARLLKNTRTMPRVRNGQVPI